MKQNVLLLLLRGQNLVLWHIANIKLTFFFTKILSTRKFDRRALKGQWLRLTNRRTSTENSTSIAMKSHYVSFKMFFPWIHEYTGNSPGYPPEMFVNCADVAIVGDVSSVAEPFTSSTLESPKTSGTLTTTIGDSKGCSNGVLMCHGTPPDDVTEERFCNEHCRKGTSSCTTKRCYCQCENITCKAIGAFAGQTSVDAWCTTICTLTSDLCSTANRDRCNCVYRY